MRKLITLLTAALLAIQALPAAADSFRHREHRAGPPQHHRHHSHHDHRPHHGNPGLAWGIAGMALGGVLLAETWRAPPVVVAPAPARPPGQMWYYCDAYGAYYPYVGDCPGGWRAVPPY